MERAWCWEQLPVLQAAPHRGQPRCRRRASRGGSLPHLCCWTMTGKRGRRKEKKRFFHPAKEREKAFNLQAEKS